MSESSGPIGWNQKIIDEFRSNAGKVGGYFAGAPMILIHHIGARSGTERVNPLVYLPDGDDMIIAATKGGAPTNPDWYHNLKAHPRITVEVGTATFPSRLLRRQATSEIVSGGGSSRCALGLPRTRPRPRASFQCSG